LKAVDMILEGRVRMADAIVASSAPGVVGGGATVRQGLDGETGAKVEEFPAVGRGLGEPMEIIGHGAVPDIGVERLTFDQSSELNSLLFQLLRKFCHIPPPL